jgi:hypothetical protein
MEITIIDPKEFGLEAQNVLTIEQAFLPKIQERNAIAEIYNELIKKELTPELCIKAKKTRLQLTKVRTGIAEIHKTQKAFFLASGKFVDAWKNKETLPVEQMEEKLAEIENHFIAIEKQKIIDLQKKRIDLISPYTDTFGLDLGNMQDDIFNDFYAGRKKAFEDKIEAERVVEGQRLKEIEIEAKRLEADRVEREKAIEKQRIENEKLKKEAELKAKALEVERKKQADVLAKQKQEADAKLEVERIARVKLEKELQAKKDAETKAENERKDAELKAKKEAELKAKAPIKEQMTVWVDSFEIPKIDKGNETSIEIAKKFNSFKMWAKSEIEKL